MAMYHMSMPPHMGVSHQPSLHSPLYPPPLLSSQFGHGYPMQSYASQSSANDVIHSVVMPPQHPIYINPYINASTQGNMPLHSHPTPPPHPHMHTLNYPMTGIIPGQGQNMPQTSLSNIPTVAMMDDDLRQEMDALHLGYIESEDSPRKIEEREKLEGVIMKYLAVTPHIGKFVYKQVFDVLQKSINSKVNFSAHHAACAFDSLGQYAVNLISQPWRKEFREIKVYSGFWIHQISRHLVGAESILVLLGYQPKPLPHSRNYQSKTPTTYVLDGVIDPDLISRLALDCMIAYCECQALKKINEGVRDYGLTMKQIFQFRQLHVCDVDLTLKHLIYTIRPRIPHSTLQQSHVELDPPKDYKTPTAPSLPAKASYASVTASNNSTLPSSTPALHGRLERSSSSERNNHSNSDKLLSDSRSSHNSQPFNNYPHQPSPPSSFNPHSTASPSAFNYSRSIDTVDAGKNSTSHMNVNSHSQVPTAQLIDLDSSLENGSQVSPQNLIPKVIQQKRISSKCNGNGRKAYHHETPELCSHIPSPETLKACTIEEHLEATMSLVRDHTRNTPNADINGEKNSYETSWDFVFKTLEEKGYNKDIGDRGDILQQLGKQITDSSNTTKDLRLKGSSNKPLAINQALQQLAINESRERMERPCSSSKSSHSPHIHGQEAYLGKRTSVYDNISTGFETAPGDSDFEDKSSLKLPQNRKSEKRIDHSRSLSGSSSRSGKGPASLILDELPKSSNNNTSIPLDDKPWYCVHCTYRNHGHVCTMCGKSRNIGPEVIPLTPGGRQCPTCTLINKREATKCSACDVALEGCSTYI